MIVFASYILENNAPSVLVFLELLDELTRLDNENSRGIAAAPDSCGVIPPVYKVFFSKDLALPDVSETDCFYRLRFLIDRDRAILFLGVYPNKTLVIKLRFRLYNNFSFPSDLKFTIFDHINIVRYLSFIVDSLIPVEFFFCKTVDESGHLAPGPMLEEW